MWNMNVFNLPPGFYEINLVFKGQTRATAVASMYWHILNEQKKRVLPTWWGPISKWIFMKIEIKARGLFFKRWETWIYSIHFGAITPMIKSIISDFLSFWKKPPSFYFNFHENLFTNGSPQCGKYPFLLLIHYLSVHTRNSCVASMICSCDL